MKLAGGEDNGRKDADISLSKYRLAQTKQLMRCTKFMPVKSAATQTISRYLLTKGAVIFILPPPLKIKYMDKQTNHGFTTAVIPEEKTKSLVMVTEDSLENFKRSVDNLLSKRAYFISQVLPKLKEGQDF